VYGVKEGVQNGFKTDNNFINTDTFLTVIGFAAYSYEGIGLILPIMETTSRPDIYPHILVGVILLLNCIFMFFGILLYFSFGRDKISSKPLVTDILPSKDIPITIVEIIWVINIILTYPLMFYPSHKVFESYVYAGFKKGQLRKWLKNLTRTIFVSFTVVLSLILADTLDKLESINGAFACIPMAFVLPCLFHYKLLAETKLQKIIDLTIVGCSLVLMVVCSVMTFLKWND